MESSIAGSTVSILAKLLADEKEDTRRWLRAEMDLLLDSMFHRLTKKLMMINSHLEQTQSDCAGALVVYPSNHIEPAKVQQHQPSPPLILKPQTSNLNPQSNNHQQEPQSIDDYEPENDPKILAQVKREIEEEEREMQLNMLNIQIDDRQGVGEETSNESIKSTGQKVQSNHKPNSVNDKEYAFNDCVNVGMERIKREAEHDDAKQVTEGDDQVSKELSRPVKKPRLDQPNNAQSIQQGSSQPKQPNQVSNHDDQLPFITISLQCPKLDCLQMIPKAKFVDHLNTKHSISPFRCAAKDCDQSFSDKKYISHIKFGHLIAFYTNEWQCDKCSMQFNRIAYLNNHTILHHQLGHFRCSFPSCTFTGEFKAKVVDHYTAQHKQQTQLNSNSRDPVHCSWAACDFATTRRDHFEAHHQIHFPHKPCSVPN